jgi:hypothetical protein
MLALIVILGLLVVFDLTIALGFIALVARISSFLTSFTTKGA